jgi:hypothetical protein
MANPFTNLPPMTLKDIKPSDNLVDIAEKTQYNFDQVLLYGGGPKGKIGDKGSKGLPGATTVGIKGDTGTRGSNIFFPQVVISDGDNIINVEHKLGDVVIDNNGDYLKVESVAGVLKYNFEFNINTASVASPYWLDQGSYQTNPIATNPNTNLHVLLDPTLPNNVDKNIVLARRSDNGGGFDKSEYYRVLLGLDKYPSVATQNATLFIANIPHDEVLGADQQFFAQVGFKYRNTAIANVGANTVWVVYKEELSRYTFAVDNLSVGVMLKHDTSNVNNSTIYARGANIELIGQSLNIDTVTERMKINISPTINTVTNKKDIAITNDTGVGSSWDINNYQYGRIVSDSLLLQSLTAAFPTIYTPATKLKLLAVGNNIEFEAVKLEFKTGAIDIGDGISPSVITNLLNDVDIISSGGKNLSLKANTILDAKLSYVPSATVVRPVAGWIDITGINSPVIVLGRATGSPVGTYSNIINIDGGTPNQIVTFFTMEGVTLVDSHLTGFNMHIDNYTDRSLAPFESVRMWNNPFTNTWYQVDNTFTTSKDGVSVLTAQSAGTTINIGVTTHNKILKFVFPTISGIQVDNILNFSKVGAKQGSEFFIEFQNPKFSSPTSPTFGTIVFQSNGVTVKSYSKFEAWMMVSTKTSDKPSTMVRMYYDGSNWIYSGYDASPNAEFWGNTESYIDVSTL